MTKQALKNEISNIDKNMYFQFLYQYALFVFYIIVHIILLTDLLLQITVFIFYISRLRIKKNIFIKIIVFHTDYERVTSTIQIIIT